MKAEDYLYFSIEELIDDSYFKQWAIKSNVESDKFWKSFLLDHPQMEEKVELAKNLLLSLHDHFDKEQNTIDTAQTLRAFHKLKKTLPHSNQGFSRSKRTLLTWLAVASSVLVLVMSSIFWDDNTTEQLVYVTGHGKRMELILPDSSTVQLNANSKLTYSPESWTTDETRKVELEGEAFFSVKRKSEGTKFIVKAGALNISVVGTEFNVRAREEKSQIVLAEGKVELAVADQQFDMEPGDMISYLNKERVVESKKVQALDYTAWKDGMTVFNNSLIEVTKELETLFGVQFVIDESLTNRKIQLSAPTDDLSQVLEILSLVYKDEIAISREAQQIFIKIPKK